MFIGILIRVILIYKLGFYKFWLKNKFYVKFNEFYVLIFKNDIFKFFS